MNLEIDFRSGIPIYLQVVERIKERIAGGTLALGSQLPTVRSLALELRVNFNTIARAYRIMDESGIIPWCAAAASPMIPTASHMSVTFAATITGTTSIAQMSIAILRLLLISYPRLISVPEIHPPPMLPTLVIV